MIDRKGVTAMEYGVIAAGIVLVVATAAATLGTQVSTLLQHRREAEPASTCGCKEVPRRLRRRWLFGIEPRSLSVGIHTAVVPDAGHK